MKRTAFDAHINKLLCLYGTQELRNEWKAIQKRGVWSEMVKFQSFLGARKNEAREKAEENEKDRSDWTH